MISTPTPGSNRVLVTPTIVGFLVRLKGVSRAGRCWRVDRWLPGREGCQCHWMAHLEPSVPEDKGALMFFRKGTIRP